MYNYGAGAPCGGAIIKHQNAIYRSFDGGLARINDDLSLEDVSIGSFDQSQVYHVEKIEDINLNEKEKKEFMNSINAVKKLWEAALAIDPDLAK